MDQDHEPTNDATVAAVGKVSEAFEVVEEARGLLYAFHRRCGTADLTLIEGVRLLREAGHDDLADQLDRDVVGRDILPERWSYQVVEEYDDGYYAAFKKAERTVRTDLQGGRRHVFEAQMRDREQGGRDEQR